MEGDDEVLAAIDKANPMRARSPLARWMLQNHDAFASRYTARRADWSVLARVFVDSGLKDADGNPPTPVTARKTWQRVRESVAKARSHPPTPTPAAARHQAAESPRPRQVIQPARQLSPTQPTAPASVEQNDDMKRILAEMDERTLPLTKPLKR
jgi:hypothetical protein